MFTTGAAAAAAADSAPPKLNPGSGFSPDAVRSTSTAFAAVRPADGSIVAWGDPWSGGSGAARGSRSAHGCFLRLFFGN